MGVKYKCPWVNAEGDNCRIEFDMKGYSGGFTNITGGMRAFVLREFNSDNDFYKPIRPQQAEIEILADVVSLEDFLFNEDDGVKVNFYWKTQLYWTGWLLQDDFQESWIDTNHFITLRATEQLSGLNLIAPTLSNGHNTPLDFLLNAIGTTSIGNRYQFGALIINNLYYDGMVDKISDETQICLDQMYISNQTFQKTLTTFEDYQTILQKINTSFNQTVFQYLGAAYFIRMSEMLTYHSYLPAIEFNPLLIPERSASNNSFLAEIGINETIKPIMPEMLRQVVRPYKKFQIDYKYIDSIEVIANESFQKGSIFYDTTTEKNYNVDNWLKYYGSRDTPTYNGTIFRQVLFDANTNILDNSAVVQFIPFQSNTFAKSESIYIQQNEKISIKISIGDDTLSTYTSPKNVMQILFVADNALPPYAVQKWGLNNNGDWVVSPSYTWDDGAIPFITAELKPVTTDFFGAGRQVNYTTIEIESKPIYTSGVLTIILYIDDPDIITADRHYKDFNFKLITRYDGIYNTKIIGDYDRLTKTEVIKNNYQEEIYLDDANSYYLKGAIKSPLSTLTGDNWYRLQTPSERYTFKREKAIAHWLLNRRYRQLIDVTLYGITWNDATRPIGLMNRFVFVDDAPTKQFMIVNLQELNFVTCQWKATLIEIYDSAIDTDDTNYPPHTFDFLYSE